MNNARYTQCLKKTKKKEGAVSVCECLLLPYSVKHSGMRSCATEPGKAHLLSGWIRLYVTFAVSDKTKVIKLNTATLRGSITVKNIFIYRTLSSSDNSLTIVTVMGNLHNIKSHFECFISVNDYICSSLTTHKIIPSRFPVLHAHDGWIAADFIF